MSAEVNDFYIFLPSNVISETFKENTNSNFSTDLPCNLPILNTGKVFECALCEITIPFTYFNVLDCGRRSFKITKTLNNGENHETNLGLQDGYYATGNELAEEMTSIIKRYGYKSSMIFSEPENKIILLLKKNEMIEISQRLSIVLGFSKTRHSVLKGVNTANSRHIAPYQPQLGSNQIYVYSDIVKPTLVGNTYAPILRQINVKPPASGHTVTFHFINKYYMPLSSHYIKSINIDIRDATGKPMIFQYGVSTAVLHFREQKKSS